MRTDETPRRGTNAVFWRDLINSAGAVSNIIYLLLVAAYERDKNRALLPVAESELRKLMQLIATHHPRFDVDHSTVGVKCLVMPMSRYVDKSRKPTKRI